MDSATGFGVRPRSIGELADLTFVVYRRGFRVFAGVGIVTSVLNTVLLLLLQAALVSVVAGTAGPEQLATTFLAYVPLFMIVSLVVQALGAVVVAHAVEDLLTVGALSAGDVLRRSLPRFAAAAWTALLVSLAVCAGLLFCIFPGLILGVLLVLALPVVALEGRGGFAAMRRSIELVIRRGPGGVNSETNWVRIVVLLIATLAVLYSLSALASMPTTLPEVIGALQQKMPQNTMLGPLATPLSVMLPLYLLVAVVQGLYTALGVIPWPLIYYDIRARHEGADLERLIAGLATAASESSA